MRNWMIAAAFAATAALSAAPAVAAQVYAGETVAGTMNQSLNTGNAYVGESVSASNVRSGNGSIGGATLYGHVAAVQRAGMGRPAKLRIIFTQLRLANGTTYGIDGVVTAMNTNTKSNVGREAIGAVGGMIAGNILGKTIFHSGMGGLLGAAGGFLIAHNDRQNMAVPAGSAVRVDLRSARLQARR